MRILNKVTIIGAGAMGTGIAQVCAQAGYSTCLIDTNAAALQRSRSSIEDVMNMLVNKGKISSETASFTLSKMAWSTAVEAVKDSDIVIEAIVENHEIKVDLFKKLVPMVSTDCILASNTSSLSITALAAACDEIGGTNPGDTIKFAFIRST